MSLDGITYANKSQILKNPALAQNEWSEGGVRVFLYNASLGCISFSAIPRPVILENGGCMVGTPNALVSCKQMPQWLHSTWSPRMEWKCMENINLFFSQCSNRKLTFVCALQEQGVDRGGALHQSKHFLWLFCCCCHHIVWKNWK